MAQSSLPSSHSDYIHDIKFDFYGRRLATCSGDQNVCVYTLEEGGNWVLKPGSEWQAHKGVVWRLSWAHPEFGQLLATAGADHMVHVWEEQEGGFDYSTGSSQSVSQSRWISKAQLTEARKSVNCVEFAPRHVGLRLATGSSDGVVRLYEAIDVMNLNHWPMSQCFDAALDAELGVSCLSWCGGRFEAPMLAVGAAQGRVAVWRFSDATRQWQAAYQLPDHGRAVLDVAWCPNVGRSFHLIATTGRDGALRLHRLKRLKAEGGGGAQGEQGGAAATSGLEYESSATLDAGGADMWRLGWNVTGTVLAASGDGGVVQVWKSDFTGTFKCVKDV